MNKFIIFSALLVASALARPQAGLVFPKRVLNAQEPEVLDAFTTKAPISTKVPKAARNYVPNAYEREQNQAARYEFSSDVDDHISDLTQQRTETREGLSVKGMYSYSDGYYKRTVHYEADENGYRVTGMEAIPLQVDGPQVDLSGSASVSNAAHGTHLAYKVQSVPVEGPIGKIVDN